MTEDTLTLTFPPVPAYVSTARLFVGAVARQYGVDEERVGDLKVAVSEACTSAIRLRRDGEEPVAVVITTERGELSVRIPASVERDGDRGDGYTTGDLVRSLSMELIQALFPEARTIDGQAGPSISFSVPLP